jgi:RhtB (resistance to homoserine/threonine) family protein
MQGLEFSSYLPSFIAVGSFYLLALLSPGPDFVLTLRNSLTHSRKIALYGVLGTTTGIAMHLTYAILGIGYLITNVPWLLTWLKVLGAAYLIYLGYKKGFQNSPPPPLDSALSSPPIIREISPFQAFHASFLTNALNPMVVAFLVGVLSSYLGPQTPLRIQFIYACLISLICLLWFSLVALCFSHKKVRTQFNKFGPWIKRITGAALIIFGLRLLLTLRG